MSMIPELRRWPWKQPLEELVLLLGYQWKPYDATSDASVLLRPERALQHILRVCVCGLRAGRQSYIRQNSFCTLKACGGGLGQCVAFQVAASGGDFNETTSGGGGGGGLRSSSDTVNKRKSRMDAYSYLYLRVCNIFRSTTHGAFYTQALNLTFWNHHCSTPRARYY
jgi:hypothetical protein